MVLESIIKPAKMEKHPLKMLVVGFFYSSLGLLLALFIFSDYASLAGVFITTLPLVIVMINTVKFEEEKDFEIHKETFLIKEHGKALSMFFFLFMGMVVSYSFWFTVLPVEYVELFRFQVDIVRSVQSGAAAMGNALNTGNVLNMGNALYGTNRLETIIVNNFKVLAFCILFSFLYGAGAIFILTLNASVIGVAVGSRVREYLGGFAQGSHADMMYRYFNSSVSVTFCYMFHGLFEVSAYIVGALAGGIISVAVVNHDFRTREFWHIVVDSSDLIVLSLLLLVLGAVIEVYVTPLLCCSACLNSFLAGFGL
jgi:uncharacterized membrane protein SpoIIM required for sporulation